MLGAGRFATSWFCGAVIKTAAGPVKRPFTDPKESNLMFDSIVFSGGALPEVYRKTYNDRSVFTVSVSDLDMQRFRSRGFSRTA